MKRVVSILLLSVLALVTSVILRGNSMTEQECYSLCVTNGMSHYHAGLATTVARFESSFDLNARGVFVEHQWVQAGSDPSKHELYYAYGMFQIMGYNLTASDLRMIREGSWPVFDQMRAFIRWFSANMPFTSELDFFTRYVGSGEIAEVAGEERFAYWEENYKISPVPFSVVTADTVEASPKFLMWILIPLVMVPLAIYLYKKWKQSRK